jgi:hypothetical protein
MEPWLRFMATATLAEVTNLQEKLLERAAASSDATAVLSA